MAQHTSNANGWLGVGALSAAGAVILTWVCCLPILAGLVGVGVASLGATIEPARPYLLAIGFLFVGAALYRSYRRPDECGEGQCATPSSRRRAFLWFCAAGILFAAAMPYIIGLWVQATL